MTELSTSPPKQLKWYHTGKALTTVGGNLETFRLGSRLVTKQYEKVTDI